MGWPLTKKGTPKHTEREASFANLARWKASLSASEGNHSGRIVHMIRPGGSTRGLQEYARLRSLNRSSFTLRSGSSRFPVAGIAAVPSRNGPEGTGGEGTDGSRSTPGMLLVDLFVLSPPAICWVDVEAGV